MATLEKMTEKLKSLEERLELIGHVPSQKEDRVLYARIKYYYTKYPNNPQVKHLIEKYPFPISRKSKYFSIDNIHKQIQYFEDKLKVWGVYLLVQKIILYCINLNIFIKNLIIFQRLNV